MDPRSEQRLKVILLKEPHELNDYDRAFLRARRDYLASDAVEKYREVLEEASPSEDIIEEPKVKVTKADRKYNG